MLRIQYIILILYAQYIENVCLIIIINGYTYLQDIEDVKSQDPGEDLHSVSIIMYKNATHQDIEQCRSSIY